MGFFRGGKSVSVHETENGVVTRVKNKILTSGRARGYRHVIRESLTWESRRYGQGGGHCAWAFDFWRHTAFVRWRLLRFAELLRQSFFRLLDRTPTHRGHVRARRTNSCVCTTVKIESVVNRLSIGGNSLRANNLSVASRCREKIKKKSSTLDRSKGNESKEGRCRQSF